MPEDQENLTKQIEHILEITPTDKKHEAATSITSVTERFLSEHFRGPLPHPRHLAMYEEILPGAAAKILAAMDKEQDHRHYMDRATLTLQSTITNGQIDYRNRGQWLGFGNLHRTSASP